MGFPERERGIEEQTPLGAGIGDTGNDRGAAQVAKGKGATLGVDQAQISSRYDLVESMPERAKHRTSTNPPRGRVFSDLPCHFTSLTAIKQRSVRSVPKDSVIQNVAEVTPSALPPPRRSPRQARRPRPPQTIS